MDDGDEPRRRRRPMSRIGDLIPRTAVRLGLQDELRRARFLATFDAIEMRIAEAEGRRRQKKDTGRLDEAGGERVRR